MYKYKKNQNTEIDSKKFKKYFFHGIDNKEEVKEGILYFSSKKVYEKYSSENWYKIPNEQLESEIVQEAAKKYKHFYRFVTLNDTNSKFSLYINEAKLQQELRETMTKLRNEKKVIDSKAGIFFTKNQEAQLQGEKHYVYGEGLKGEDAWTKQIYDILESLETTEEEDGQKYYEYFLLVKWARAVNRKDEEEAVQTKKEYERLQERQKGWGIE